MSELHNLTIRELLQAYHAKRTSPVEVCQNLFARIDRYDQKIGAYLHLDREGALRDAKNAEKDLRGALAGVPIAIKDVISTKGMETTAGSKILAGYIPPYDATVITKLKAAGAIILGKTNCDEFAMGSSTENSSYQLTRNPWNYECSPGGSSGGSAATVAAGLAYASLGSDTGGSIRQPAAFCGIAGLKPTYGRVSRFGLVAFGSSLDCIGPLTRSIDDAALLMKVIAGYDPKDSTSAKKDVPDYSAQPNNNSILRIGVPEEYFEKGIDSEVANRVQTALDWLERSGKARLVKITLPHTSYAIAVYYLIATAEASSNLSRYDGVRFGYRSQGNLNLQQMYEKTRSEGFGAEVKRRVMLGTFALSSGYYDDYYIRALKVRSLIVQDFQKAFQHVDLICAPTTPTAAFRIGEKTSAPLSMYLNDIYTVTMNLAGLPAISIPCGFTSQNLPVGLQIIGNYFDEQRIFRLASIYMMDHPFRFPEFQ